MHPTDSVVVAMIVSFLLQRAKTSPAKMWTWLSSARPWIIRLVAAVVAALTAAGIAWDYSGTTLTITGLSAPHALSFLWDVLKQYLFQDASYRLLVKPSK